MTEPLAVLQRIRESRPRPAEPDIERCELCSEPIGAEHGHLVDVQARNLMCACRGCYLLFTPDGAGGGHFKSVPDRYADVTPDARLTRSSWEEFQIPVGVAFFFQNSALGHPVAFYPGPAGATESELPSGAWEQMLTTTPALEAMEPDVEALLVRAPRAGAGADERFEAFIVPIDVCYELVGRLRQVWRGFDGGREAHQAIDAVFASARQQAP